MLRGLYGLDSALRCRHTLIYLENFMLKAKILLHLLDCVKLPREKSLSSGHSLPRPITF